MGATQLPPGPRLGLGELIAYGRTPYELFRHMEATYGDPFTLRTPHGKIVMTGRPELAKQIYAAPSETFDVTTVKALTPMLGRHSLILQSGLTHKRNRKLLSPPFVGEAMRNYETRIAAIAAHHAEGLQVGQQIPIQDVTQAASLDVIIEVVFGVTDERERDELRSAIHQRIEASHPAILFVPGIRHRFLGLGPWARFERAMVRLDGLLRRQIRRRVAQAQSMPGSDVLSLLCQARYDDGESITEDELRDQLLTLLVAGHETSGSTMAWVMHYLHTHPAALAKLRQELDHAPETPSAYGAMPFLDAVCKETMRLRPVIPDIMRKLTEPMQLGSHRLPAGSNVGVALSLVHGDPNAFEDPTAFRPERFIERRFPPHLFMPFGGGGRRCLGAAFALHEMRIIVGTLVRRWNFEALAPAHPARMNFTVGPHNRVPLRVTSGVVRAPEPVHARAS